MPHVNSSGGDDLASTDEVKVYKDEGEEEKTTSENLSEDKLGLVTESEEGNKSSDIPGQDGRSFPDEKGSAPSTNAKGPGESPFDRLGVPPIGYPFFHPYPFANGATVGPLGGKVLPPSPHGLSPLYMYPNSDHFSPPPAHIGIPPVQVDPKTGLPRAMYSLPPSPGQFSHPLYPELSQVNWSGGPAYPITATGLRGPYPTSLSSSPLSRFSPPGILAHPGLPHLPHPAIVTPGPKQDVVSLLHDGHRAGYFSHHPDGPHGPHHHNRSSSPEVNKKNRIKKPLNAFMLFMKEMRQQVIEECTLKESAAINQILGRRWHALDRSEQAKYYEMARKEKELHQQLYPGWSARDNYATHNKKTLLKKRKREMSSSDKGWANESNSEYDDDCPNAKKCRARFGLDQQTQWCKPCRRKKKCIRFLEDGGLSDVDDNDDDDNDDDNTTNGLSSPMSGTAMSKSEGEEDVLSPASNSQPSPKVESSQPPPPSLPPPLYRPVPLRDGIPHRHHHHHHHHHGAPFRDGMLPPPPLAPPPAPPPHSHHPSSSSTATANMVLAT